MFCNFCGHKIDDGAKFCPKCGKMVAVATEKMEEAKPVVYESPVVKKEQDERKNKILKFAILGLAFAVVACIAILVMVYVCAIAYVVEGYVDIGLMFGFVALVPFGVLGAVFSQKASELVAAYIADYGETDGRATVGKSLALPGKIIASISIGLIICAILVIVLLSI